jgi:hypothetical protein
MTLRFAFMLSMFNAGYYSLVFSFSLTLHEFHRCSVSYAADDLAACEFIERTQFNFTKKVVSSRPLITKEIEPM